MSTTRRVGALAIAATCAIAACGGGSSPTPSAPASPGTESVDPGASTANLSGEISISGSSTVQPISQGVQELFNETHGDVAITVDGPGTGDGFALFCDGQIDIADASRAIRDDENEAQKCAANGVEYVELKVAIDGLSVLTSAANADVSCLSYADLYALIGPESEGVDNWNGAEALAHELGSTTDLPDAELQIFGPGEESGTYDYFVADGPIGEFAEDRSQDEAARKDYNSSPNDNVILQGIEGFDTSLGWVGYAFAIEGGDLVKLLAVSAPDGECVDPTPETIAGGDYPLARDLFIYVNTAKAAENPALAAFVDFYLASGTIATVNETVGYIDLTDDVLAETRATWDGR